MPASSITLNAILSFKLDLTIWALHRGKANSIDQWDGRCYTRLFIVKDKPIKVINADAKAVLQSRY